MLLHSVLIFLVFTVQIGEAISGEIVLNGAYLGKNLFIRNTFSSQQGSFCITAIYVNGVRLPDLPKSSAIQIDLSKHPLYSKIEVKIQHHDDCVPVVINPEVIMQMREFGFLFSQVDDNSINWITAGESPEGIFLIEKMKWEGWEVVDSIPGKGQMDNNQYSIGAWHYSGDNLYRLIYRSSNAGMVISEEINFYSLLPLIKVAPSEKVEDYISLSRDTDYQIFDEHDKLVLKGFGGDIDVTSLPYGNFTLIIENEPVNFYRLEPEPIPRIRRKRKKNDEKSN